MTQSQGQPGSVVARTRLENFAASVLAAAGADAEEAELVARILVWADRADRATQGVWRLPILSERLERGLYRSPVDVGIDHAASTTVGVDGRNGLGQVVADRAMRCAIDVASEHRLCLAGVRNSNFFGPAGYYASLAADAGLIGIAMSNSFPKVAPFGGSAAALGTNPIAFAAPRRARPPLLLDMSTSASSGSAVRWKKEEDLGDAEAVESREHQPAGLIGSFGGPKGFGLGLMVDILAGALTGAGVAHDVRSMYHDFEHGGHNGHLFIAVRVDALVDLGTYEDLVERLVAAVEATAAAPDDSVRLPGQARWDALAASDASGITVGDRVIASLTALSRRYDVPMPW